MADDTMARIRAGEASEDELIGWLGVQHLSRATAEKLGEDQNRARFWSWYDDVMAPLAMDSAECWRLFTGEISSAEFTASLSPAQSEALLHRGPGLQAAHVRRTQGAGA